MEKEKGTGVQPHQAFLRFYDSISGEDGIQPVRVMTSGKAKFELVSLAYLAFYGDLTRSRIWHALQVLSRQPPPTRR